MSHKHSKGLPNCQNCHHPLDEMDKFCPNCGQHNTDGHVTLHDLWHELSHYFTHVDNKIFITIRDLFVPGRLTEHFFKGHRKRYIHPINLFFLVAIILPWIMGQAFKDNNKKAGIASGFIKEKELYRNDLLFEMDSILKTDNAQFPKEVKIALDTFLLQNYHRSNNGSSQEDSTERGFTIQFYVTLDKLQNARNAIKLLNDTLQIDKAPTSNTILIRQRLTEYENWISRLKYDSITSLTKVAQFQHKSIPEAQSGVKAGLIGYNFGKSMALKGKEIKTLTLDSIMNYPVDYDLAKIRRDSLHKVIQRDSLNVGILTGKKTNIDELDLINLSNEEIFDKYNITGFWNKLGVKQIKKFGKQGFKAVFDTYANKSVWISIVTLFPSAWFLLFMYRRQNRLYVEHLVFLIHFSTLGFILSTVMLLNPVWGMILSIMLSLIALAMGIKRFYQQSWGKTILKTSIFYIMNSIFSIIISLIGFTLSIVFS